MEGTDNCAQNCTNTDGSYMCNCSSGYRLHSDGYTCNGMDPILYTSEMAVHLSLKLNYQDINECEENTDGCSQNCRNTPGSFRCGCNPGFELIIDDRTCRGKHIPNTKVVLITGANLPDVDECLAGTHLCTQTCVNIVGSYVCSCGDGYRLNEDRINCSGW